MSRSSRLNAAGFQGCIPADLAFLAMAHWRLGHTEKAQDYLNRLRVTTKEPLWAEDEEAQAFLREAEALLQGLADKSRK